MRWLVDGLGEASRRMADDPGEAHAGAVDDVPMNA
jgi:hypothetical protein